MLPARIDYPSTQRRGLCPWLGSPELSLSLCPLPLLISTCLWAVLESGWAGGRLEPLVTARSSKSPGIRQPVWTSLMCVGRRAWEAGLDVGNFKRHICALGQLPAATVNSG